MEGYRSRGWAVILAGDLNMVASVEADVHPNLRPQGEKKEWSAGERKWFERAVGAQGKGPYVDSFRALHPEAEAPRAYSYWDQVTDARGRNEGYRIDYVLVSRSGWEKKGEEGGPRILAAEILLGALKSTRASDHAPVMVQLALSPGGGAAATTETQTETEGVGDEGGGARKKAVGCVKHKVDGQVVLQKLLPDKRQRSLKSFFSKPAGPAASASDGHGGGGDGPAAKKAKPAEAEEGK